MRLIFRFLNGLFYLLYKSSSIFILGNRFSLLGSSIFFRTFYFFTSSSIFILGNRFSPILLLFYKRFHVFLTIAICNYLCFAGEVVGAEILWFSRSYIASLPLLFHSKNMIPKNCLTDNFSLQYQYILQPTFLENKETYQLDGVKLTQHFIL